MPPTVEEGFMVFLADGQLGVGAVRKVHASSGDIVVYVENAGDFTVPRAAVRDVHSGKVILDTAQLPAAMREALRHPHDAEDPNYGTQKPPDDGLDD